MGVIQNQTIKNSLINYLGAVIGSLSTILIYPLSKDIYGYAQFLYATAYFFLPFASLGINASVTKFYPKFKTKDGGNNGLLFLSILISFLGFALFFLLMHFNADKLIVWMNKLGFDQAELSETIWIIVILTFLLLLIVNFTAHINNLKSTIFPNFVVHFSYKIFLPVAVYLYFIKAIDKYEFTIGLLFFYGIAALLLICFLIYKGQFKLKPKLSFIKNELGLEIAKYSSFSSFNAIGSILAYRLDIIMVSLLLGFKSTGAYGIFLVLANLIEIPLKALFKITNPLISAAFEENDITEISSIYKKSSINLGVFGIYAFLGLWLCMPDVIELTTDTEGLKPFVFIFFFLGLGKLVDTFTSVNNQIIIYSKYYKYNLIFIVLLGALTIITNYYFINLYGLVGAAIATFMVMVFYNGMKLLFIYFTLKIQPFSLRTIYLLGIAIFSYFICSFISFKIHPIFNILIKASIFSIVYLLPVYYFRIAPDLNSVFTNKLKAFLKS